MAKDSNIILNLRLRHEATCLKNPNGPASFKDAVKGKVVAPTDHIQNMPGPYIVERVEKAPTMDVKPSEVTILFVDRQYKALI